MSVLKGHMGWLKQPLPGQRPFLLDRTHRFIALEGGLGAGKTVAGAWKSWSNHIVNAFDAAGRPTYAAGMIIGDTYDNLYRYDVPAFLDICEEAGVATHFKKSPPTIHVLPLGTRARPSLVHLCSAESPDRISGISVGWFWGDEAARWSPSRSGNPRDDALTQVLGRLRDEKARLQQGIFTYTNEGDATPIYRFMRERCPTTALPKPDRAFYVASTRDNIHVGRFIESQLATLSPELVRQYVDGEAIHLCGARAYTLFDPAVHVSSIDLRPFPGVPLCMTLDFNINPGMHALVGQRDRGRDLFIITHEIHQRRMDVRACAARFAAIVAEIGGLKSFRRTYVFGDATGRSEWAGTSESCYTVLRQCLEQAGIRHAIRTPRSNPRVSDRVHAVQCALRDVGGASHVLIHPRCKGLIADLEETNWDESGTELDKRRVDVSHFTDALGYWVSGERPVRVRAGVVDGRVALGR